MDSQQEPTNTTSHVVENDGEVLSYESITGSVAFEEIYNSEARRTDKLQSLVTFPEDNLITETFTKPQRTAYASRPAPEYEDKLDPYIKVCFECFSADWILVRSSYSGYQRFRAAKSIFDEEVPLFCGDDIKKFQLPAQKQLTLKSSGRARNVSCPPTLQEVEDAEASADDHIDMSDPHFNYVKPYTKRTDAKNKKKRLENRYALFEYYDPNYDWQPGAEVALCKRIRKTQRPDTSNESVKFKPFYFTVTPGQLAFQLGVLEPFFASLTLYQIDSKTYEVFQISEKFHFQNNSKAILDMLFEHWNPPNCDIQTNTALFSVTRRSKQVYLVLELSKVLQGDYENAIDPYNKIAASFKQKDQEKVKGKIKNEAADYCNRLGKYKQPFAWSILQVFDMKGNLLLTPDTKFTEIYARATKETIPNIVTQYDNALETKTLDVFSKKYRDLHGVFCFEINKFEHESFDTVRLVDTSLQIKKGENASDDAPLLKEIHEFPQNASFVPNFFYINNMYVHLLTANLSSRNGKTVVAKLQVKDTDQDINAPGLKCICDPYSNCLVDEIYSTAHYRNKAPIFSNEFKLILPPKLTSQHHILFTFYNITVNKKKRTEYPETPIAYVVIPLYPDGRIVVHNIEGCYGANLISKLEPDYVTKILSEPPPTAGKASVVVRFNLVSTIFPEDKSITEFLNIYHTSEDDVPDKVLVEVLQRLQDLSELLAIQYLPVIINNLLEVMVTRSNNKPQFEAFRTLVMVTHKVRTKLQESGVPRTALLELYSNYIFRQTFTTNHAVFKAICSNFLLYLMDFTGKDLSEIKPDSLFVNSWFFFDIVVKSMALKLKEENKLNQPQRKGLFDDIYVRTLSQLLKNLAKYFKEQMSINPDIRILNKNLALFMNDLFSVFDRGIVLDMIRAYLRDMTNPSQELLSTTFKVEFLRIISDNEHYIPLNLLFCNIDDLTVNTLTQRHPVAYTVIFNVLQTMKSSDPEVWPLATDALYDVVVKNAFDARYQDTESQERIAAMYFVLIPMFIDAWDSFTQWRKGSSKLAKREFYICILYVLRTCNRDMLTTWWRGEITTNQVLFLELLRDIVITFEYFPELKRPTKTLLTPEVALFINKVGTEEMREILRCISKKEEDDAAEDKRLRLLTIEVNILVLDVLENFISDVRHSIQRNLSTNSIMSRIVDVLCAQMNCKQSPNFVHHLYASLRSFAYKFADVLFKGDNEYLSLLLEQILMHCNAPEPDVNIEASSMLFILLKLNQKTTGSFGRTKIQAIATLSNLVQSKQIEKDIVLYRSFNRLTEYALHSYSTLQFRDISPNTTLEDDHVAHAAFSSFSRGIQDMCETFTCILRDTLRVNEISETEDKHMIADLYYQIADGYKHTPDLRLTWLKKLTALQQSSHNNVEAGITFSHAAALIADYLISSGKLDGKLFNMNVFSLVSPNIKEFSNAEEEGVCQSADFSTDGLRRMVSCAIGCFESAEYYEFAAHLFKIITPLDEKTQSYRQLAQSYEKLRNFWQKVNEENEMRLFGKYFRVGFFGSGFGELNGREFVYKEPKLTHILELTDTLKTLYGKNTKEEIQHLDAGADLSKIDTSKEYLQITKIDPYIIEENRETFFEQNTNLANFVYETPFTQSGKSHADDVSQQFKRKTILTVAGSFPSMLTRLPVIRKRDVIVTPIENAIEDVEKRNAHIATEVNRNPVNPKTLTQVLQGSALPQVNEGALSICKIFLTNFTGQPAVHVLTLAESLTKFLNLVREGLSRNKEIINTDHDKKFHFEMEAGFKQLEAEINQYIGQIQVDKNDDPSSESSVLTQDDDITDDSDISLHRKIRRTTSRKRGHTLIVPGTSSESQTTKAPKSDQYPRRKKSSELKNSFPPAEGSQANSLPELKVKKGEQVIAPSALVLPAVPPPSHDSPAPSPISAKHAPIPAPLVKVSIDVGDSPSTALRPKGTPKLPAHKKPPPPAVPPPPAE